MLAASKSRFRVAGDVRFCLGLLGGGAGLFASLFRQNGGVEPAQAQSWIGCVVAKSVEQRIATRLIVDENVALLALDQRQNVEFARHCYRLRNRPCQELS